MNETTPNASPRKLVIFADGTGNAFGTQESNVWRIYQALDRTDDSQIPFYIKGVGTSSSKIWAALDGATGFGVPSNVRKLYSFICWNWTPDTQLYMFGFSRGAFTIRTLVGMIHHEGILPREIDNKPVSKAAMARNVMAAWRHYRKVSFGRISPIIGTTRLVRDILLKIYHAKQMSYEDVRLKQEKEAKEAKIEFLGLFDTVEAYGVPIEELRAAIDKTIWPISFQNYEMSEKVQRVSHALSLDDERTTFHPLRIHRKENKETPAIKEVWFAGVHSDVGGGYPEDQLAHEPLCWMLDSVSGALPHSGLKFVKGTVDGYRQFATPLGPRHDSRNGLHVFYRYDPRYLQGDPKNDVLKKDTKGGVKDPNVKVADADKNSKLDVVVHHSVAEKIAFGSDRYAPIMLPSTARILMPNGTDHPIQEFDVTKYVPSKSPREAQAVRAAKELKMPSQTLISLSHDMVWWRRVVYFLLLFSVLAVVLLPWSAEVIAQRSQSIYRQSGFLTWLFETINNGFSSFLTGVFAFAGSWLPSWLGRWIDVLAYWPLPCLAVLVLTAIFYTTGSQLRDRIADLAYQAWLPNKRDVRAQSAIKTAVTSANTKSSTPTATEPEPSSLTRSFRKSVFTKLVHTLFAKALLPTFAIILFFVAVVVGISRSTTTFRDGAGTYCTETPNPKNDWNLASVHSRTVRAKEGFNARSLCWSSGAVLTEGRRYRVWILPNEELFADTIKYPSTAAGFASNALAHLLGAPLRRWYDNVWFHPIGRIGRIGNTSWPLVSEDGDVPSPAGATPSDAQRTKPFVATFTAKQSGEFFLYVNDVMVSLPIISSFNFAYENNKGTADVYIQQLASEPPPAK